MKDKPNILTLVNNKEPADNYLYLAFFSPNPIEDFTGLCRFKKDSKGLASHNSIVEFLLDNKVEIKESTASEFKQIQHLNIQTVIGNHEDKRIYKNNYTAWPCDIETVIDILRDSLIYTFKDNPNDK
jgi:hypothetical protein